MKYVYKLLLMFPLLSILCGCDNTGVEKDVYCAQFWYGQYTDRYDFAGGTVWISDDDIKAGGSTGKCLGIFNRKGNSIDIQFPTADVMKLWAEYDKQYILIKGTIQKNFQGNYYIYNPRFIGYN